MPQKSPHEAAVSLLENLTLDFQEINYDRFERVCLSVGLDPDKVRKGQEDVRSAEIGHPFGQGRELLGIMLKDVSKVDLDRFEKPAAEEAIACIVAGFFFECLKRFEEQRLEVLTTLTGVELTPSELVLARMSLSPALSPGSARQTTATSAMN